MSDHKSSRGTWLVLLSVLGILAVTLLVLWSRIIAWVQAMPAGRIVLLAIAGWGITALGMYLWRVISLLRLRRASRRTATERQEVLQGHIDSAVAEAIELAAITTEWAVRAELVRDDVEDVQEYMQRLVKRPLIRRAFVAKADGIVVGAGDRSLRGKPITLLVPQLPTDLTKLQKNPLADEGLLFVVPVMGLESRLGTLILEIVRPHLP